jgi:hypothetical protein
VNRPENIKEGTCTINKRDEFVSVWERRTFGQAKALEHIYHLVSISNHYLAQALEVVRMRDVTEQR